MRKKNTAEGMTRRDRDYKRGTGGVKGYERKKVRGIEDVIGGKPNLD